MTGFNPAALHSLKLALDDDSHIVQVDDDEVRRIASAETRRRCAGIKLASRIAGMASAISSDVDDQALLKSMENVMRRVAEVRSAGLGVVGVTPESKDFPATFNALTNVALDVVTEEWKWSRVAPGQIQHLPSSVLTRIFVLGIQQQESAAVSEYMGSDDLALARKLCFFEAIPKIFGVINFFDFYQKDRDSMVLRLVRAIVDEAERLGQELVPDGAISFTKQSLVQRLYGVSVGVMCEVYKEHAARAVTELRSMTNLERSVAVTQYERQGGMQYDCVMDAHSNVLTRVSELSELVFESQQRR